MKRSEGRANFLPRERNMRSQCEIERIDAKLRNGIATTNVVSEARLVGLWRDLAMMLGDRSGLVELAGLVPTWDEAKVGAGCPRPLEPTRFIDGGGERSRGLHTDARDALSA
jgi:hypothetical protein